MDPLHVAYRPKTFDEVIGNRETVNKLESLLSRKDGMPHIFLAFGPMGCGKTSIARLIPEYLEIPECERYELNSANYSTLSDARELERTVRFKPMKGDKRFWLMDESHRMSKRAQDCLLKVLEEPPEHVYICFSTTEPHLMLPTLRDRCQPLRMKPFRKKETEKLLTEVLGAEEIDIPNDVVKRIAKDSGGIPRTALVMLDSVMDLHPDDMLESIENSEYIESSTIELALALLNNTTDKKLATILDGLKGEDPEQIRRAVLGFCANTLTSEKWDRGKKMQAWQIMEAFEKPTYNMGWPAIPKNCYEIHFAS